MSYVAPPYGFNYISQEEFGVTYSDVKILAITKYLKGMNKTIEQLAKELDFETADEYFQYIVDSEINGQHKQVLDLFKRMKPSDKEYFMMFWIDTNDQQHINTINTIQELLWT